LSTLTTPLAKFARLRHFGLRFFIPGPCHKQFAAPSGDYRRQCPDFPHQTTVDQWFDESQFESYRQLGLHIVEELVKCDDAISLATFLQQAV
jgi:hypothetical protein